MDLAATIPGQGQRVNGPKEVSMARRRYQKGSLVPKQGPPRKWALGRQVARRRDSAGWNHHTAVQMGSLGNNPGLPDTEARPARSRNPFVNHQQSNLSGKANVHVRGICESVGRNGPFPTQTQYPKRHQEPIATVAVAGAGQLCSQGPGRTTIADICFPMSVQLEDDQKPRGNASHDVEQCSGVGLCGSRPIQWAGSAQTRVGPYLYLLAGRYATHHCLLQRAVQDVLFDSGRDRNPGRRDLRSAGCRSGSGKRRHSRSTERVAGSDSDGEVPQGQSSFPDLGRVGGTFAWLLKNLASELAGSAVCNENGTPWDHSLVRKRKFHPLLKKLGIPQCGFHAFRHGNATLLDQIGAPMAVRLNRLGHAEAQTTMGYTHAVTADERRIADELGKILHATARNEQKERPAENAADRYDSVV